MNEFLLCIYVFIQTGESFANLTMEAYFGSLYWTPPELIRRMLAMIIQGKLSVLLHPQLAQLSQQLLNQGITFNCTMDYRRRRRPLMLDGKQKNWGHYLKLWNNFMRSGWMNNNRRLFNDELKVNIESGQDKSTTGNDNGQVSVYYSVNLNISHCLFQII